MQNTPQSIAEACAEILWQDDQTSQSLGMQLVKIAPGMAALSMTVTPAMVNGHSICHGGYLFTLADSTFAFACNTYNQRCVAQHCNISYLAPVYIDDKLQSTAVEVSRSGRNAIYDIRITNQKHEAVVEFRGYSRTIRGTLLSDKQLQEL